MVEADASPTRVNGEGHRPHPTKGENRKHEVPFVIYVRLVPNSITHFWAGNETIGGDDASAKWKKAFGNFKTLNLGYGWDRTGNVLWRLKNGEMDGTDPNVVVIHIGGNNFSATSKYIGDSG